MRKISESENGLIIKVDDEDDLWTLAKICRSGVSAGMLTHRRDSTTGTQEGGRSKQADRKPMWIVLRVEEAKFQPFTDNLRLRGVITESPIDIGSHHTHNVEVGSELELSWVNGIGAFDLDLVDEAVSEGKRPRVGLIVVENNEVILFEIAKHGIREVSSFTMRGGGKRVKDSTAVRHDFFENVSKEASLFFNTDMPVIICGPGLSREVFESYFRKCDTHSHILNVATSIGGRASANEVIFEGLADAVIGEYAVTLEVRAIEEGLKRVSSQGPVAYGIEEIKRSADQGAVEVLVIVASMLRDGVEARRWLEIAELVKENGGDLVQASVEHDAGKQLVGFGGALALLRWGD